MTEKKATWNPFAEPEYEHVRTRQQLPGEEFNRENNIIVFDDADLSRRWNIEALGEVLKRLGVEVTYIADGGSDLVLEFKKI